LRAPASIVALATVLLIGCVLVPAGSFYLWFVNPAFLYFLLPITAIEFAFSLLDIVTSIGLLLLREPARKAAFFRPFPFSSSSFALMILVGARRSTHNLAVAIPALISGALFVILLPLSVCWLVRLRRDRVRSQFRQGSYLPLVTKGLARSRLPASHHSHLERQLVPR
jgi:hypothetical protein